MQTLKWFRVLSLAAAIFLLCGEVVLAQSGNLYNQLVEASKSEVAPKGGKLTIALNWTNPQGKAIVEEFKKDFSFVKETKFERLRTVEDAQRAYGIQSRAAAADRCIYRLGRVVAIVQNVLNALNSLNVLNPTREEAYSSNANLARTIRASIMISIVDALRAETTNLQLLPA